MKGMRKRRNDDFVSVSMLYGDFTTDFLYIIFVRYVLTTNALDQSTKKEGVRKADCRLQASQWA